jgi:cysteinyl-tRNA synthetase
MSQKYLKTDTLDIHAGGRDLIFPHHENEIAQSESFTGKEFAKFWIHHGLLTINGQKMSKSLGNFVTIKGALKDLPDNNASDILKLFFLNARYSHPIDYSKESIEEAKKITKWVLEAAEGEYDKNKKVSSEDTKYVDTQKQLFEDAMDDDFNMPRARTALFELVKCCNRFTDKNSVLYARYMLRELGGKVFGLSFNKYDSHDQKWGSLSIVNIMKEEEIKEMIDERNRLRSQKKYEEADKIRKELEQRGIILEDTAEGTQWRPA